MRVSAAEMSGSPGSGTKGGLLGMLGPSAQRGRGTGDRLERRSAYSLIEVVVVLVLLSVLLGLAIPPIGRMRTRIALRNARAAVTTALVEARKGATRFQRTSVLTFDGATGVIRAAIDTASTGFDADTLLLGRFDILGDHRVSLQANRGALCFDGTGVGTVTAACPQMGAEIVLRREDLADTLLVNAAGRVWR